MQFSSLTYNNRLRSKIQLNQSALCYPNLSKWIFRKDSIHHTTYAYLLLFNKGEKLYQNHLKAWNFAWALLKTQYVCNRNFLNVFLDDKNDTTAKGYGSWIDAIFLTLLHQDLYILKIQVLQQFFVQQMQY